MALVRLICPACGKRGWGERAAGACVACGASVRAMSRLESLVDRLFGPAESTESEYYHRHRQLMVLLWSADGRGQEYYNILRPGVAYSRFIARVTDIVCQGVREGWVEVRLPAVPTLDDAAYGVIFHDADRFAAEVTAAFGRQPPSSAAERPAVPSVRPGGEGQEDRSPSERASLGS
jgi:hypothetical protein